MQIRTINPEEIFFLIKETKGMKFDVLRAIINLDQSNNGDWLKFKEWLKREFQSLIPNVIFTPGLPNDLNNTLKGMAMVLGALDLYFTNPAMALANAQAAAKAPPKQTQMPQGMGI